MNDRLQASGPDSGFSMRDQLAPLEAKTAPERLDPRTLTGDSFRSYLVDRNNQLFPDAQLDDFVADRNYLDERMGQDSQAVSERGLRYPAKDDKQAVLDFALRQAQLCDDPEDQALLLASAVVNSHLMLDGNGRLSRDIYRSTRAMPTTAEPERVDGSAQNEAAREQIDLGTAFSEDPILAGYVEHMALQFSKLPSRNLRVGVQRHGQPKGHDSTRLSPQQLEGLSESERVDLADAIGADEHGNTYSQDQAGLKFATIAALTANPELESAVHEVEEKDFFTTGGEVKTVGLTDVFSILDRLDASQKKEFVAALWRHRQAVAVAKVAALSPKWGGRQKIEIGDEVVTIRDLAIARTANAHPGRRLDLVA